MLKRSSPRNCKMTYIIGRGFAECQILKSENSPILWTEWNILINFCVNIDIDKISVAREIAHWLFFIGRCFQGSHWSGKSQVKFSFLQGQGKVREFCKLVREILNIKKVMEKSVNFIIWAKNGPFLSVWKCWFFSCSILLKVYNDLLEHFCPRTF